MAKVLLNAIAFCVGDRAFAVSESCPLYNAITKAKDDESHLSKQGKWGSEDDLVTIKFSKCDVSASLAKFLFT